MERIKSFRINELKVSNFKCFEGEHTFSFGDYTVIYGSNGRGKSSIADAIAYVITGVTFFGEARLDRLYTNGLSNKALEVILTFTDGQGISHTLKRVRVNDRSEIFMDDKPITQAMLNILFGEKDVFLSILNPLYFIDVLNDKGRNLLERYLPAIPHEQIMGQIDDLSREKLADYDILSIEAFLKSQREEKREMEKEITYYEGQRDLLATQARKNSDTVNEKLSCLESISNTLTKLKEKQFAGIDVVELKSILAETYANYDKLLKETPESIDTSNIDTEIANTKAKLSEYQHSKYQSVYTDQISQITSELNTLKKQYAKDMQIYKGLKPGVKCSTCRQTVTTENLSDVRSEFQDRLKDIHKKGQELTLQLKGIQAAEQAAEDGFIQSQKEKMAVLQTRLEQLSVQRKNIITEANSKHSTGKQQREALYAKIQDLESKLNDGNLSYDELQELSEAERRKTELEQEIALLQQQKPSADAAELDINELKEELKEKEVLINSAVVYATKKNEIIFSALKMNRVSIGLYDVVKSTGEIKGAFRFMYEGRPYKWISLSEKIRAGLEISQLISKLTDSCYPVLIDNGESVPVIDNIHPKGQIIMTFVAKGEPLTVQGRIRQSSKEAA